MALMSFLCGFNQSKNYTCAGLSQKTENDVVKQMQNVLRIVITYIEELEKYFTT